MTLKVAQVRIILDEVRKDEGSEAVAAILKQVGAINADTIDPSDYPQVARLCGHGELADGAMTCRIDDDDADTDTPLQRESKARKPLPMETVIRSQSDTRAGFDLAAKALHARRPKS